MSIAFLKLADLLSDLSKAALLPEDAIPATDAAKQMSALPVLGLTMKTYGRFDANWRNL